jgi:hypothetical protein
MKLPSAKKSTRETVREPTMLTLALTGIVPSPNRASTFAPPVALTAVPPCHPVNGCTRPRQLPSSSLPHGGRSPGDLSPAQTARKSAVAVRQSPPSGARSPATCAATSATRAPSAAAAPPSAPRANRASADGRRAGPTRTRSPGRAPRACFPRCATSVHPRARAWRPSRRP